jgi:hypothetical protein
MNNIIFIEDQNFELETKWDNFVASHPEGQIYFTTGWLKIIQQESGEKLIRLACVDDEENILGVMPLVTTKGFPLGMGGVTAAARLSSLPRTPIGGPLSVTDEINTLLLDEAIKLLDKYPGKILQVKSFSDKLNDSQEELVCVPWRESYILEIPEDKNKEIRFGDSKNHTKIKTGINKSKNSGVRLEISTDINDLKEWYLLFLDTMRIHSTPARSLWFFQSLWKQFYNSGKMKLYKSIYNNKMIAGSILFYFNGKIIYAFNGSNRDFLTLRPNDLIHWQAIADAQQCGYRTYDFGEVSKNDAGLAAYKKKWGTKIIQIYHYYFPEQISLYGNEIDIKSVHGWKQKIVEKMPLNVSAMLGKWTYKYL